MLESCEHVHFSLYATIAEFLGRPDDTYWAQSKAEKCCFTASDLVDSLIESDINFMRVVGKQRPALDSAPDTKGVRALHGPRSSS